MPMSPDEVAELSRLLDEAQALEPARRESWLSELDQTKPQVAQRLRDMLDRAATADTKALPEMPKFGSDYAVAAAGERVGPYALVQEIGRGGMGSVWLAERADGTFKRRVALKLPRLTWAAGLGKRMTRERDIGALLEHPSIARLYDAGVDEHGRPYIAMEYIDGQPIDVYCRDHALDLRARLKLFVEVAQAVAYAHGRLVLHRDLKPANVLVDAGAHGHLLDFGIAKLLDEAGAGADLTQEQGRVLTLYYASPEQIAGRPLGVTADVYSLGVLLFELLTGTLPYTVKRNTAGAVEDAILAGDAPLASSRVTDKRLARGLRGDIDAILAKAIKLEPDKRYPTAVALATDIQRYLDGQTIFARPDSGWYRLRKQLVRHRVPVAATSAVLAVAVVGGATTLTQSRRAVVEVERTQAATAFISELFRVNATQQMPMNGAPQQGQAMFVDRGAQLIESRFQRQPELKAEMYGVVGRVYADLGIDRLATEYATRQLEALRAQRASALHIARSLMLLSEVALIARRGVDAEEYARQAVNALPRDDKLVPDALALLARVQVDNGKNAEAAESSARAKKSLEDLGETKSAAQAWLLFVDGELLARRNRFDDGKPFYSAAIAQALEAEGPASSTAIGIRLLLAERLINRNRADEAREFGDPAIAALESLGGISGVRAARWKAFLQVRKFENRMTSHAETMAVLGDVSSFLRGVQSSSVPAEVLAEIDFYKARAYLQWGEFTLAKPLLDSSATVLRRSTQSDGRKFSLAVFLGIAAMYTGDHDAADKFLRERMELRIKRGWGNVPFVAFDWAYIALNLSLAGRHHDAEAFLSDAPAFGNVQGDSVADYRRVIPETLARIRLQAGNIGGAKQALPTTDPPYEDNLDLFSAFQVRGEVMCAAGEHAVGVAHLKRSIDSLSRTTGPNHPGVARLRAVAGLCALLAGDRKLAGELADLARSAFVAQPGVSPFFREPQRLLDERLRS